jgi:hypothetical protein
MASLVRLSALSATAGLLFASSEAHAACFIGNPRPIAAILVPTGPDGQRFDFDTSPACEHVRFTIPGTTVSKNPTEREDAPTRRWEVVLTEDEWNAVVAASDHDKVTWVVTGRSEGVTTRFVHTNELDREDAEIVISNAGAKLRGSTDANYAGSAVAGAGDTNGDGHDDVLVGASYDDPDPRTYLVLGPVSGTFNLGRSDALLMGGSESVASAGDVDGDGSSDILVGSSRGDDDDAWLVLGPASGTLDLDDADANLVGETGWGGFGVRVAGAGDVNDDGHDDMLVAAFETAGETFAAYLIEGPVTGTADAALADAKLWVDPAPFRYQGDVAGVGDVDGDGQADLLIGAPGDSSVDGATYFVRGPVDGTIDLATSADTTFLGPDQGPDVDNECAGASVSSAGDTDGDGRGELLIGAPCSDLRGDRNGVAYLVRDPRMGTRDLARADARLVGRYEDAGWDVASGGDVDGDGHDDLLIGAPFSRDGRGRSGGAAYLMLGPVTGTVELTLADLQFIGTKNSDLVGRAVAGAGDVDADGLGDLIIGAPGTGNTGAAYVISGAGWSFP